MYCLIANLTAFCSSIPVCASPPESGPWYAIETDLTAACACETETTPSVSVAAAATAKAF